MISFEKKKKKKEILELSIVTDIWLGKNHKFIFRKLMANIMAQCMYLKDYTLYMKWVKSLTNYKWKTHHELSFTFQMAWLKERESEIVLPFSPKGEDHDNIWSSISL